PLGWLGRVIVFALLLLLLTGLVALIAWAWRRFGAAGDDLVIGLGRARGSASRVGVLPAGLGADYDDPWAEARRRRDAGALAGAVICLFVHQMLTLERLGLARLAPGRTARQLVRAVPDPTARRRVEPTLRLFEAVYYGHRVPAPDAFAAVWD